LEISSKSGEDIEVNLSHSFIRINLVEHVKLILSFLYSHTRIPFEKEFKNNKSMHIFAF